ncbi:serine/threonine protein kinase [Minicystis rosea]|nr:serine/threonine protein kinase [Minicystis rosea]
MDRRPPSSSTRAGDTPAERSPSERVIAGKYHLVELLGRGGRGAVYSALQAGLGREVAVKLIQDDDEDVRARFLREARIAAEIRHPGVVAIYDAGVDASGTPYCVMELLEGESLAARITREERIPAGEAVALVTTVAAALQAVHAKGFLHRDIKPSNVFLAKRADGGVDPKLIDFGIAKRITVEPEVVRRITTRRLGKPPMPKPTEAGIIVGTPCYLSPEQIMGEKLDERTDVYALAATLYEALTGTPPFPPRAMLALLEAIVTEPPEPIAKRAPEADVPPALDREVRRALAKDPAERHASAADFSAALRAALAGTRSEISTPPPPLPTTSRVPFLLVVLAAFAAVVLGVAFLRRSPTRPPSAPNVATAITATTTAMITSATLPPEPTTQAVSATPPASASAPPRPRSLRPVSQPTQTHAPAPAPNLRMDDLKVPY